MKSFTEHLKKAARILLGLTLVLLVFYFIIGLFSGDLNQLKTRFSYFLENIENRSTDLTINSVFRNSASNSCDEKEQLKQAKQCTFLVGSAEIHGSSFLVDNNGTLITNYHVIDYSTDGYVDVFYEGEFHKSRIVGFSVEDDLAIVEISTDLEGCSWANSNYLELAESVYAVGWPNSPFGESTITKGVYSRNTNLDNGVKAIQTDTPINPGNSGGPLISKCGVVGINTSKIAWIDETAPSEGIGFAISSNYALGVIRDILSKDTGEPAIPTERLSEQEVQLPTEPNIPATPQGPTQNSLVPYDYEQVIFWEQRRLQDQNVLNSWGKAENTDIVDEEKLGFLLDILERSVQIANILWDGYTNSKITYGQVLELKQEYLTNSNQISILSQELNIEGSITAYKSCVDAWEELEDEYGEDFSEQKEDCEKFVDF